MKSIINFSKNFSINILFSFSTNFYRHFPRISSKYLLHTSNNVSNKIFLHSLVHHNLIQRSTTVHTSAIIRLTSYPRKNFIKNLSEIIVRFHQSILRTHKSFTRDYFRIFLKNFTRILSKFSPKSLKNFRCYFPGHIP